MIRIEARNKFSGPLLRKKIHEPTIPVPISDFIQIVTKEQNMSGLHTLKFQQKKNSIIHCVTEKLV